MGVARRYLRILAEGRVYLDLYPCMHLIAYVGCKPTYRWVDTQYAKVGLRPTRGGDSCA